MKLLLKICALATVFYTLGFLTAASLPLETGYKPLTCTKVEPKLVGPGTYKIGCAKDQS